MKTAWKNLLRNKVYSIINIAGLSIGLACCMLIILYGKDELSYDRFHDNADNIYRITTTYIGPDGKVEGSDGSTGMMPGPAFKREIPEVNDFVRIESAELPVKIGSAIFDFVTTSLFCDLRSFVRLSILRSTTSRSASASSVLIISISSIGFTRL